MSRVVGIDLGTVKTTAAVVKDGKPVMEKHEKMAWMLRAFSQGE